MLGLALSRFDDMIPAWIPCTGCENFWCTIHGMHAHDCSCPPIEEWTVDPYSGVPLMPVTIPTQFKLTEAERARLDELGRLWGEPEHPLPWVRVIRRMLN